MQISATHENPVSVLSVETRGVLEKMINGELERLGLGEPYQRLVERVVHNLAGIEFEWKEKTPDIEILEFLKRFHGNEDREVVELLFARQIAQLEAWYYRAMKNTPGGPVWWNPLEQSLSEFCHGSNEVQMYHDEHPYPPNDMVRAWSCRMLREQ